MSDRSTIEWTAGPDGALGATWNPVRGCSRVSEGCRNCYAERVAARFSVPTFSLSREAPSKQGAFSGFATMTPDGPRWTGRVELVPEKLDEPLRWKKPRRIFVNSMSDLFHESLADEAINRVFAVMAIAQQHTFLVLTKRADRMQKYLTSEAIHDPSKPRGANPSARYNVALSAAGMSTKPGEPLDGDTLLRVRRSWPLPNVWLGVSVEDQETADDRIQLLLQTPAAVRFVSAEPLLQTLDLVPWIQDVPRGSDRVDWVIVGGESGPGARPFDIAWARSTVKACREAGVACFVKQLGAFPVDSEFKEGTWAPEDDRAIAAGVRLGRNLPPSLVLLRDRKGGDSSEWPTDLRVREFPREMVSIEKTAAVGATAALGARALAAVRRSGIAS